MIQTKTNKPKADYKSTDFYSLLLLRVCVYWLSGNNVSLEVDKS